MDRNQFDETERCDVSDKDFKDALKGVLLALRGKARSESREPTKVEPEARRRLDCKR